MSAINDELSEITIQQQNLKDMLHDEESEPTDQQHLDMLKSQLEALTARQLRLLSEQSELLQKHRKCLRCLLLIIFISAFICLPVSLYLSLSLHSSVCIFQV